jgi:hypothetical protein
MTRRYVCQQCGETLDGDDLVLVENFELRQDLEGALAGRDYWYGQCAALAARVADLEEKLRERGGLVDEMGETLP